MNIAALSSQLTRMPDQALIKEMQSPSGSVPQFLVLSELQRRKQMRTAGAPAQAPTSSVAADILSEAPRQMMDPMQSRGGMGLGGLPQRMAQGGAVHMRKGGNTVAGHFYDPWAAPDPYDRSVELDMPSPYDASASVDIAPEPDPYAASASIPITAPVPPQAARSGPFMPGGGMDPRTWADFMFGRHKRTFDGAPPAPNVTAPRAPVASVPQFNVAGQPRTSDQASPYVIPQAGIPSLAAAQRPDVAVKASKPSKTKSPSSGLPSIHEEQVPQGDGTSVDEMVAAIKKFQDSGIFPEAQHNGMNDKLQGLIDNQAQQAPWLSMAKAGFKMASGTSPFFATNAGEAMAGMSDDLHQQQVDQLKEQLELAGLSSREAEAEATRRVNVANMASRFMDRQDSIAQRREDSRQRSLDRGVQMANTREIAAARIDAAKEAREARLFNQQDTQTARYYAALTSQMDTESRLADSWDQKAQTAKLMGQLPADAVNPHLARLQQLQGMMSNFNSKMPGGGIKSIKPAAAQQRDPLGLR